MARGESIDKELREAIVRGELAPDARLRMEELKYRFDVGFSPIREALSKLLGEGLVVLEPNRGFRVASLSRADLLDVALARIAIETHAVRLAIRDGDDRWEGAVVGAMHRYRKLSVAAFECSDALATWEEGHDSLHATIIRACGSPRLLAMQARFQEQHLRYRRLIVIPEVSRDAHIAEHQRVVDLVLARDADGAAAAIARHMMITVEALAAANFWDRQAARAEAAT